MNQFSIRDIENLCGVKAHTLRIWEQRYQLFIPKRKESQHRIYDSDDLKELLRISFLYHNGYKISKIAGLSPEQIQEEVAKVKPQPCNYEVFVHQLIEASLSLDKEKFDHIADELLAKMGMEKCILHVFYPFLQRIGLLWMTNHVIPAQEHFSSHIIRKKILAATDRLTVKTDEKYNVVIFSPAGELHEIPLLVVNFLLKKRGVKTTYFGTDVATETLVYYAKHHAISHFYAHLITRIDSSGVNDSITVLCKSFPAIPVIISGPACHCIREKEANLTQLGSLDDVLSFANSLATVPA
ncbi:MAG: MerR family transcriptional regulator [Chitinophagales bacterium]|nr:MerR family transcriptional regulator [Chitinophagales bacterium]